MKYPVLQHGGLYFFDTELAFDVVNGVYNDRLISEICEVYVECQKLLKGKCHGVVWCPVYNGGWTESHQSRRIKEKVTRSEMLVMLLVAEEVRRQYKEEVRRQYEKHDNK